MDATIAYALHSAPIFVYVIDMNAEKETFLGLTVDTWTVLIGLASSITAAVALLMGFWQARATRRHNMLMVRPHLDHKHVENNEQDTYQFEVTNDGVGPAIIKSAQIFVDNQPVNVDEDVVVGAILALFPGVHDDDFGHESVGIESYVAAGQVISLMTIKVPTHLRAEDVRNEVARRTYILATYESIYGELFKYDSRD
ncbi:hypothetical protein [Pseudomonas turukhanskensis]|uniref:Uncharacterized protein n=1 Tax=Pseudomonas turukhanskensis TaxID=1806536 RepID=A0A9W6K8D2_9PSED|nr:hypothetical protein [Pseudomonas turukhanskensis]GLK90787.1 hypothetical protein GCM10017655_38510 [Pseudomonas turukhanskensis]